MPETAISFSQVSKKAGRQIVLDNLSFNIAAGEFVGLVGLNGAGKTTLFKSLLDLVSIDMGSILLFEQNHHDAASRRHLAYLPERFLPPAHLNGADFLRFILRMHERSPTHKTIEDTLQALDFPPAKLREAIRTYSKGTAQKLGLAACILADKPLLILDEPMSGLDPAARLALRETLTRLKHAQKTLLMSSHSLSDVEQCCDRMILLHDGQFRFDGSPPRFLEHFAAADADSAFVRCIRDGKCAHAKP